MKWVVITIGALVAVIGVVALLIIMAANMMSDDPGQQSPYRWAILCVAFGIALVVAGAKYG